MVAQEGFLARTWKRVRSAFTGVPALVFDSSAEIALHVARHEAYGRGQLISPVHLLYGLLQDEAFVAAIAQLGGDATAIEHGVLATLDAAAPDELATATYPILLYASSVAQQNGRLASCADLWNILGRTEIGRLVEAGHVHPVAILFALVHGCAEPAPPAAGAIADVVLRNDDFSTKEFVVEILRDVFGLAEPQAIALMEEVHQGGSAIVGDLPLPVAVERVTTVRTRARERGYPLWIHAQVAP